MEFKNKVAVVTGASSGIGKQVSSDLAALGCKVVLIGRDKEKLSKIKAELSKFNKDIIAISCDVSNRKHVEEAGKQILEKLGHVDILINAAGYGKWKGFQESTIEDVEDVMKTNYFGTIYMTKVFFKSLSESEEGHLVNIASLAGLQGMPNFTAYCASKFAVVGFSESLHNETFGSRLNVTVICPGAVNTNFFDDPSFGEHNPIPKNSISPELVSKEIINAIKNKKFLVVVPKKYRPILAVKGFMPNLVHKQIRQKYKDEE